MKLHQEMSGNMQPTDVPGNRNVHLHKYPEPFNIVQQMQWDFGAD